MQRPTLTDARLVSRLEEQRQHFSKGKFPFTSDQRRNLKAYSDLVVLDKVLRNTPKRRAQAFLQDVWHNNQSVFILCALSTTLAELRYYQSTEYLIAITLWWTKAQHPEALQDSILDHKGILPGPASSNVSATPQQHETTATGTIVQASPAATIDSQHAAQIESETSEFGTEKWHQPKNSFTSDCYLLSGDDALQVIQEIHRIPTADIHLTIPHTPTTLPFITIPVSLTMIQTLTEGRTRLFTSE